MGLLALLCKFVFPGYGFTAAVLCLLMGLLVFYNLAAILSKRYPKPVKWIRRIVTVCLCLGLLLVAVTEGFLIEASLGDPEESCRYILVLGAKVREDGPSLSLMDRIRAAYDYLEAHPELPQKLADLSEHFRTALKARGIAIRESKTPIVPIFTYQAERTLHLARDLYESGVYVNTVLPPAAPADGCMLRTSLMATHTEALLDEAADVIQRVLGADHA